MYFLVYDDRKGKVFNNWKDVIEFTDGIGIKDLFFNDKLNEKDFYGTLRTDQAFVWFTN